MISRLLALFFILGCDPIIGQQTIDSTQVLEVISGSGPDHFLPAAKSVTKPERISNYFTNQIFHQNSLTQLVDNYIDDAHVHFEGTAGYDKPNPYLMAFTGASFKWTKYYYDGLRINNPLIAGDASFQFPLENTDVQIDGVAGSLHVLPFQNVGESVQLKGLKGGLGDRVGFTDWFLNNISGHRSAGERQIFPIELRPLTSFHTELVYNKKPREGESGSPLHISLFTGSRVHLDQDYDGSNTAYDEQYFTMLAKGNLTKKSNILGDGLDYIFRYSERDNFGAEYQYQQEETSKLIQLSTAIYTKRKTDNSNQVAGIQINALRKAKRFASFSRNIIDQDGEGFYPYEQDGRQQAFGLFYSRETKVNKKLSYHVESMNTLLLHSPSSEQTINAVYLQSTADDFRSLHAINWEATSFSSGLLENTLELDYQTNTEKQSFKITGGLHLYGMLVNESNLISFSPSIDVAWQRKLSNKWSLGLRGGLYPNRYDIDQIRLLSSDYLNGTACYWDDTNNDKRAQEVELGEVAFTSGGAYRSASDDLGLSHTYFLDLPLVYRASSAWQWTLLAQYRQYRNTWSIEYTEPASSLGEMETVGERELWFKDAGPSDYEVQPLSSDRMNSASDSESVLFDQPYYGGVTFKVEHKSRKWFFSASMTANMIVGYAGLGNGPLHNNINAPSETTANPNTRINQIGRLDTDRSFISRIISNYRYSQAGSVGITLKYKDGQSFAYYEHHVKESNLGSQVAFYQPEVRGDNPLTGERGRREDFYTNFELHGQHRFQLGKGNLTVTATLHNLLDFANETSEYIYGNVEGFSRSPLELQVPRSASINLRYSW